MKNKFIFATMFCLALITSASAQTFIANPSVKNADISKSDLRDIFSGTATTFKDGSHAIPVTLKAGSVHEEFLKAYVGKTDSGFRSAWRMLVFTGQGSMPKTLDTEAQVIDYVASTPGAVGYVSKSTATDKVKVLSVH
jgi:ABC-type phosphate transport system substrate-binding protein